MLYNYTDLNGRNAFCDIERHGNVVIATELPNNPGGSITNCAEQLATGICERFGINPEELVWIEHYKKDAGGPERYSKVSFNITYSHAYFYNAQWEHMSSVEECINRAAEKAKRKAKKKVYNEIIRTNGIKFIRRSRFKEIYEAKRVDNNTYEINNTTYVKVGNFRGYFGFNQNDMWIQWIPGIAEDALNKNTGIKAEVEGIMTELKSTILDKFHKVVLICASTDGCDAKESTYVAFGNFGTFYILRLIPRKGDYNLYLHCYTPSI